MAAGWRVVEGTQVVLGDTLYRAGERVPFTAEDEPLRASYEAQGWIEPIGETSPRRRKV